MNEQLERKWYVYHRRAKDDLREFTVAEYPRRVPTINWALWSSIAYIYKDAHKEAIRLFYLMNDLPPKVEDSVIDLEEIIFRMNDQLIKLQNCGLSWDNSLDAVDALNDDSYIHALTDALRECPSESRQDSIRAIQKFLRFAKIETVSTKVHSIHIVEHADGKDELFSGDETCECPECRKEREQ